MDNRWFPYIEQKQIQVRSSLYIQVDCMAVLHCHPWRRQCKVQHLPESDQDGGKQVELRIKMKFHTKTNQRCTTGLLNHTKRVHPEEWANRSRDLGQAERKMNQRSTTTSSSKPFARSPTRNTNKRSKAWR